MNVDVIILTKSNDNSIKQTCRTIQTLHDSESKHTFKIHLLESGNDNKSIYENIVTNYIILKDVFNYNKFLNIGLKYTSCDWVVVANDDLSYERGWFEEILKVQRIRKDIKSFSPKDPALYYKYYPHHFVGTDKQYFESYIVTEAFMGWCFVMRKEVLDLLIPFDESFDMYYQDNDLVERLKFIGIKHALVRNSIVSHHQTMNINKMNNDKKMNEDRLKFLKKWKGEIH